VRAVSLESDKKRTVGRGHNFGDVRFAVLKALITDLKRVAKFQRIANR
jgi:hypothetical protein